MITLDCMAKTKAPKEEKADEGSLKPTRKTAKMIALLALWSDQTIAEFMTESVDPFLEEMFNKKLGSGANNVTRPKRE